MVRYYRENETGDFMQVYFGYRHRTRDGLLEARSTAIARLVTSVCTTTVSPGYIRESCTPIRKASVPPEWLAVF